MDKENSKNKTMIDVMNEKDIIKKDINSFTKSLDKDQKATIDETIKLVENRSDNLVGGKKL